MGLLIPTPPPGQKEVKNMMTVDELDRVLKDHTLYLDNEGGKRANLRGADLRGVNLGRADLRGADLRKASLRGADLRKADLRGADLRKANLRGADLGRADLRGADLRKADLRGADLGSADLRGANLDFSCWPLWCGELNICVDARLAAQLAYHLCSLKCDDPAFLAARSALLAFANTMHRNDVPRLT